MTMTFPGPGAGAGGDSRSQRRMAQLKLKISGFHVDRNRRASSVGMHQGKHGVSHSRDERAARHEDHDQR